MRIIKAVFMFSIIACAGCGGPNQYWYNENNTIRQAYQDCRECHYQAQAEAMEMSIQQSRDYDLRVSVSRSYLRTQFNKCMKDKGYLEIWDYNLDSGVKKRTTVHGANYTDARESGFGDEGHLYHIAGN